jgi:hypothetical protein
MIMTILQKYHGELSHSSVAEEAVDDDDVQELFFGGAIINNFAPVDEQRFWQRQVAGPE